MTRSAHKRQRQKVSKEVLGHLAGLTDEKIEACARLAESELMAMTVSEGTYRLYTGRWNILNDILAALNEKRRLKPLPPVRWSTDLFIIFIRQLAELDMGRTAMGYFNACIFMQRADSTNGDWAIKDAERVHRLLKGASYQKGKSRHIAQRGQIDDAMFDSLLEWLIEGEFNASLIVAFQVMFLCALRISEIVKLKFEQVIVEKDGSVWLDLPNKAFKKGTNKPPRVRKPVEEPEALALLFTAKAGKKVGDFLFPPTTWNERFARDCIHAWAVCAEVEFPVLDKVFMDGPHCLRHGGMKRIEERVVQAVHDVLLAEKGACSAQNVRRYARSNRTRAAKRSREG